MNSKLRFYWQSLCLVTVILSGHNGREGTFAQATPPKSPPPAPSKIKFRPPTTAAPSVRGTGGSRGTGDSTLTLDVLAPEQTGLTTQAQPSLFWYQSKSAVEKFELTLLQDNKIKPIVQFVVNRSDKAGIQRLKLSDHGATLTPGVEYQWVVALISDPENRSSDLVASGVIKRVEPSAELKAEIATASPEAVPAIYAQAGIWYDALSALSDEIEADPRNQDLKQARADLLRQVGLTAAAAETEKSSNATGR